MTAVCSTEDLETLGKTIAVRLCAARRVSGLKQNEVAEIVGQKNMTQVSLWESGERMPKLTDVIMMARAYGVPMDFICGLSDDPLADGQENNQGFLANMISKAIHHNHMSWLSATAQSVAVAIKSHSEDRGDIRKIASIVRDVRKAYGRVKELNPSFDDDIRGAAPLESALGNLERLVVEAGKRIEEQMRQGQIIEREMDIANGEFERKAQAEASVSVSQMLLDITN